MTRLDDPSDVVFGFTFRPHASAPNQAVVTGGSATLAIQRVNDAPTADVGDLSALTVDEDNSAVTNTLILQNISFVESGDGPGANNATINETNVPAVPSADQTTGGLYNDVALFVTAPTVTYDEGAGTIALSYTPVSDRWGIYNFNVVVADDGVGSGVAGAETTFPFTITVDPIDDSPTFDTVGPITLDEEAAPTTIALVATNGPGESGEPTFEITNRGGTFASGDDSRDVLVTITNDGTLTIDPSAVVNANGVGTITVVATQSGPTGADDGADEFIEQTISIDITPVNDAPTLTLADNIEVAVGESVMLAPSTSIGDPDWDAFAGNIYAGDTEATAAVRLGSRLTLQLVLSGSNPAPTAAAGESVDIDLSHAGIERDFTGRTTIITPDTPGVATTAVSAITAILPNGYVAEVVLNMVGGGELTVRATQLFTVMGDDTANANTQELSLEVTNGEVTMTDFMGIIGLITVGIDSSDNYAGEEDRMISVTLVDTGNDGPEIGSQVSQTVTGFAAMRTIALASDTGLSATVNVGVGFTDVDEESVLQAGNGISIGNANRVTVAITDPNPDQIPDDVIGSFDLEVTLSDGTGQDTRSPVAEASRFLNFNGAAIADGTSINADSVDWEVAIDGSGSIVTFTAPVDDGATGVQLAALLEAIHFRLVSGMTRLDDPSDVVFGFTFRPHASAPNQAVVTGGSATLAIQRVNDAPTADVGDLSALTVDEDNSAVTNTLILQNISFVESGDGPSANNATISTSNVPPVPDGEQIDGGSYNDVALFVAPPTVDYDDNARTVTLSYTPVANRWGIYNFNVVVADNGVGSTASLRVRPCSLSRSQYVR